MRVLLVVKHKDTEAGTITKSDTKPRSRTNRSEEGDD